VRVFLRVEMKEHIIAGVCPGSISQELGIKCGDVLISVNGKKIIDVFDYRPEIKNEHIELEIRSGKEYIIYDIEKEQDEDIGILFENDLMDFPRSCSNKCIFCFIDQLPDEMRDSLHFKDDDIRLSFLSGNYVTLTNVGDRELERIISLKLSPINISVHTTDEDLRIKMMGNNKAGKILSQMKKLIESRIVVNTQIVIVPGYNDKNALIATLDDLYELAGINSISVVPVGITRHRRNLTPIDPVDEKGALDLIRIIDRARDRFFKKHGKHTIYAADELYIKAGINVPKGGYYEDYPQLENGVGMARLFFDDFLDCLHSKKDITIDSTLSIVTGESFHGYIVKMIDMVDNDNKIKVHKIKNDYFGGHVDVAGLLTYTDIVAQLANEELFEKIILPGDMFRHNDDMTLDGFSKNDFERALKREVMVTANDGRQFCDMICGGT
jgi:putative radical SAM enzyme (TIGR03279 family)